MMNIPGKGFLVAGGLLGVCLFAGCQSSTRRSAPTGMTGQISPQMSSQSGSFQTAPRQAQGGQQGSSYPSSRFSRSSPSSGQISSGTSGQFNSGTTSGGSGQTSGYPSSYPQLSR